MYQRILVPVDGSHTSTLGLREAIRIAIDQRARLRLINVVDEFIAVQSMEGFVDVGELLDAMENTGKETLANALALTRRYDIKADTALYKTAGGRVADIIVREVKKWKADLIVMGTHGRRGVGRMVLGSDAEAVLRATPVPVLLVRSPKKRSRTK